MKRCEFLDLNRPTPGGIKSKLHKPEDGTLPSFTTDIPTETVLAEREGFIQISYLWNDLYAHSPFMRVRTLLLRKEESLGGACRLRVRDGIDTIVVRSGSVIYLLRKTTLDIAKALLTAARHLRDSIEDVIGYLQTIAGSVYSISKLSGHLWSFDPHLVRNPDAFQAVELGALDEWQRHKLTTLVQEKLLALHRQNLILRSFTLHNVVFTMCGLILTDLRDLRAVRKRSMLVDDFCNVLRYLVTAGVASRGDVYQALASYSVAMEPACQDWYRERKGKTARDSLALVAELEQALY